MNHELSISNAFNPEETLAQALEVVRSLGASIPHAMSAASESSSVFLSAKKQEIDHIDKRLLCDDLTKEEKLFLYARRDEACEAIDRKDAQKKLYGLKVTTAILISLTVITRGLISVFRSHS